MNSLSLEKKTIVLLIVILVAACSRSVDKAQEFAASLCKPNEILTKTLSDVDNSRCKARPGVPLDSKSSRGVVATEMRLSAANLAYRTIAGWAAWKCADKGKKAGTDEYISSWYVIVNGPSTARDYKGTCAEWSSKKDEESYKDIPGTNYRCASSVDQEGSFIYAKGGNGVIDAEYYPYIDQCNLYGGSNNRPSLPDFGPGTGGDEFSTPTYVTREWTCFQSTRTTRRSTWYSYGEYRFTLDYSCDEVISSVF